MMRAVLKFEGLPARPDRSQLEEYAKKIALVEIRPLKNELI